MEDYFHVSVFDGIVPRATWDAMESRVVANTERLLALFDEFGVRATFFVLGWVAERHPDLVRRIAAAGHEVASHGYAHRLVYDQTPCGVPRGRAARQGDPRGRGGQTRGRLPGAELLDHAAVAVGARHPGRGGLRVRLEHLSDPSRSLRHSGVGARSRMRIERTAGSLVEVPASTTRVGAVEPAGRRRRLLPAPAVRVDALGHRTRESARRAAGDLLPSSRGKSIRISRGCLLAGSAGSAHYRNLDKTEARLRRLLTDFRFDTVRSVVDGLASSRSPARRAPPCRCRTRGDGRASRRQAPDAGRGDVHALTHGASSTPHDRRTRRRRRERRRVGRVRLAPSDATADHLWCWRDIFEAGLRSSLPSTSPRADGDAIVGVLPLVLFRSRLFGRSIVSMPFLELRRPADRRCRGGWQRS